ncbi:7092_t:CDS:1, partial [Rhizophagus irregularis]
MTTTINDTPPSSPLITYTVAPYNPTPNMFIPHKYRNIIPKEPLYTEEGVYIVPGSR